MRNPLPTADLNGNENQLDEDRRRRNNENANEKRELKNRNLRVGNTVLCMQRKQNSFTPEYDPTPFTIRKINGT